MIKPLKKAFIFLSVAFLFSYNLISNPAQNVKEYTLENGLKVFLLEDTTDALVHSTFVCKAGFSSQTQYTNGFFKLFTRLVKASTPKLNNLSAECNADSSIYSITFAPSQTDDIFQNLSEALFSGSFSDEVFATELNRLKNEVTQNADTMSTYINAAIDSRVFSEAPWKHDSGIYPPLFNKTTEKNARNKINEIANRWYIPKNSAIFVYGNINSEKTLVSIKNTFGHFYSNYTTPVELPSNPINKQRKYVFHNPEISNELTQVVIQYTMLNIEQADLLAATFNNNYSTFKTNILNNAKLNIPGDEYIDVSSAYKRNCSRLIIQTLMQQPEDKKIKVTALDQAQMFVNAVMELQVTPQEFQYSKQQLISNMNYQCSTPALLMNTLSSFWPIQEYYKTSEKDYMEYSESETTSIMQSRKNYIQDENPAFAIQTLQSESPFIFVIINSKIYNANKKAFTAAGYEEINSSNSSWYVQEMYKNIKDQFKPDEAQIYRSSKYNANDNSYYEKNINLIQKTQLSNGIKVVSKKNTNSTGVTIALSIAGGKLKSADNHGFEEAMINIMSVLIQKELYRKMAQGLIIGTPEVTAKTDISTSTILITFDQVDTEEICSGISNAIVFGEIAPADADRAVSGRQYKKRLENGSATGQMVSAAIKSVYGKSPVSTIFNTDKDVLLTTDYNSILESYPQLLDADRFSIIVTGNYDNSIFDYLEKSFSQLNKNGYTNPSYNINNGLTKNKIISVTIKHTFLTDIPAEKAGPQPAVLIPTTEFLDPVIFAGTAPEAGTKEAALYNAMLNFLGNELQKELNENKRLENATVSIQLPQSNINLGYLVLSNIAHIKEADVVYKNTIQSINRRLLETQAMQNIITDIKNSWSMNQMSQSSSNSGTALLIQKGFELFPDKAKPDFYLTEYNYIQNATAQDYIDIMQYFPTRAQLRAYSADGKN